MTSSATLSAPDQVPQRPSPQAPGSTRTGRLRGLWRGPATDAPWIRPLELALLLGTAVLYLTKLDASGWANAYYSAAAQAGSTSWKAFFFGSTDAANSITVDKTPAAVWFMALSVRVFGLSSFAILLPQALMGVASVALLARTVRRVTSPGSGLVAGAVLALTPVAALMFRFDNPDALMVLLLIAAAWALTRAIETGRTRWLLWVGAFIGFAFLAKMMQAFLVVPCFAIAYLVAGPPRLSTRVRQTLAAGVALVVAGGWWVAIVQLWPAASRPWIGGSQTDSVWDLMFGYNGFGRLSGDEVGSVGWRDASSATKVLSDEIGGQISWLLWAAVVGTIVGVVVTWRRPRIDPVRAAVIAWGGWLVTTTAVFSLMQGINHSYYWVALAPAVAALTAIGGHLLWQRRSSMLALGVLAGTVALSGFWAAVLLRRESSYPTYLADVVQYAGVVAAVALILTAGRAPLLRGAAIVATAVALLIGPTAFTLSTVSQGHTGALPSAGPASGGPGSGQAVGGGAGSVGRTAGGRGGMNGLLDATTPQAELTALLVSTDTTWAAATVGSNNAAGLQLASLRPVMAIGGYNGTDPSPTLAQFQQLVADGSIAWFVDSGLGTTGGTSTSSGGSTTAAEITAWVQANFTARTVGGQSVYDLTTAAA